MKRNEAGFQIKFKHWLEANPPQISTAYELKYEKKGTFNFSAWLEKQPHQLRGLLLASEPGEMCYHKISDASYEQKPFDNFVLTGADAYLVIYFEKHNFAVMCKAKWVHELLLSGKKSARVDELLAAGNTKIIV